VAKGASSLILLNDDFPTIVGAIEQGRVVHSNVQKCVLTAPHPPVRLPAPSAPMATDVDPRSLACRFVSYFLATTAVGNAGAFRLFVSTWGGQAQCFVIFLAVCAGLPVPLEPMQILFINLVTDDLSAIAISIERGEDDVMLFPPRNAKVRERRPRE
jgi:Ca2+-transporting ATPase